MNRSFAQTSGTLVSAVLAGSWRSRPAPIQLTLDQLNEVTPLLYESGAASLGWHRIRATELAGSPSGNLLQQAYRLQALQSTINAEKIKKVFRLLRCEGIEPLTFKGWSMARLYPQFGFRPYGDIDILVRPEHFARAQAVLKGPEARDCWVDLHDRLLELEDRPIDEVFQRSQLVALDEAQIRVLALEHHFALLAIHLLKHGAWRPLWLCDVGVLLESLPDDFDWDLCLGRTKLRANWITSAIGLAAVLLDAQVREPAIAAQARQIPDWLPRSVLKEWDTPFTMLQAPMKHNAHMAAYLRRPKGVFKDLANRWPNPILATVSVKGRINRLPRLPYQVGNLLLRAGRFVTGQSGAVAGAVARP